MIEQAVLELATGNRPQQIDFKRILHGAKSFSDIKIALRTELTLKKISRVGFVSGPIANTPETDPQKRAKIIEDNMNRMDTATNFLRATSEIPVFSSVDIFRVVWKEFEEQKLPVPERSKRLQELFRYIIQYCDVDTLYMMPGWKNSPGAVDEHNFAQMLNKDGARKINIVDVDQHQLVWPKQPDRLRGL